MKIIKRVDPIKDFETFAVLRLPKTMQCKRIDDGYGGYTKVKKAPYRFFAQSIAVINGTDVDLRDPAYFSDFEILAAEYEAMGGKEVRITL